MKDFLLPEAVYRQALWAAKDMPRLKEQLKNAREELDVLPNRDFTQEVKSQSDVLDLTATVASRISNLTMRIEAIEMALLVLPKKYREGIRRKMFFGENYADEYHPNTWKKWQQIYIYNVAINLGIY
jgi:hypothetical protein